MAETFDKNILKNGAKWDFLLSLSQSLSYPLRENVQVLMKSNKDDCLLNA